MMQAFFFETARIMARPLSSPWWNPSLLRGGVYI